MAKYKKSKTEKFQNFTLFTAGAMALSSTVAGGYFAATSSIATSAIGATALGAIGTVTGLAGGVALGLGFHFGANAIYENREYIVMGAALIASLPITLAGRGLSSLKNKLFPSKKPKSSPRSITRQAKTTLSNLGQNSAQKGFNNQAAQSQQFDKENAAQPTKKAQSKGPKTP